MKVAVGDLDDAAGNFAAAASTCARRRLFWIPDEKNSKFNANPCWARRLRLGASFLLQCQRHLGVGASGTPVVVSSGTFYNRHHRWARGSLLVQLLQGQCTTSPQTGQGVLRHAALGRHRVGDGNCSLIWDSLQSTTSASWELAVQRSMTSVGHGARSCSDV